MITDEQMRELSPMPYWADYLCFPQPCWHNISPGKTTMEEALAIIQSDPTLKMSGHRGRVFTWDRVSSSQAGGCIEGSYKTPGIVYGIYINEAHEHELTLKDAISIYGTPLGLHFSTGGGIPTDGAYVVFLGNAVARIYDPHKPMVREIYPTSTICQMHYWEFIYGDPSEHPWPGYSV